MSDANEEHDKIWNVYFNDDEVWDDPNFDEVKMIIEYGEETFYAGEYEGTENPDEPTLTITLFACFKKVGKKWIRQDPAPNYCQFELENVLSARVPKMKNLSLDATMELFDKL